ncbi:MAG: hypothetical protein JWP12_3867 [Bacteroidetes bacterium]|nr:hypothetical protein [Bacteroidota bacterium]
MKKFFLIAALLFFTLITFQTCKKDDFKNLDCSSIPATYSINIKPLVTSTCAVSGCHVAGSANGDFTTYAGLKAASDNGGLQRETITNNSMPPSGGLSLDQRKQIKCWMNNGSANN